MEDEDKNKGKEEVEKQEKRIGEKEEEKTKMKKKRSSIRELCLFQIWLRKVIKILILVNTSTFIRFLS